MNVAYRILAAALAALMLGSQAVEKQPPFEYGRLRALLNGREFSGIFGRDSALAIWNSYVGQLQIAGDERFHRPWYARVRLTMRCGALPKPGTYAIGDLRSPVSAEAVVPPTRWERIWPLHGARYHPFRSGSASRGTLVLDTVDSAKAIVRGRFNVSLRSFEGAPAETLSVRAAFFGRLLLPRNYTGRRAQWAPEMRTDCERIRDAVAM